MGPPAPYRTLMKPRGIWPEVVATALDAAHSLRGSVLLLGNFDGFHLGHQALLRMAHGLARGRPVAVMSCEPHPRSFFGTGGAAFRLATAACKPRLLAPHHVDFIYSPCFDSAFAGLAPRAFADRILVEALGVSHVIAGADFRFGCRRAGDMGLLTEFGHTHGFGVTTAPEIAVGALRASSSAVRDFIRAGDMQGASRLLGGGWLVEAQRMPDGRLRLHPDLVRPRPGRYRGVPEASCGRGDPVGIEITEDGGFLPMGPHPLRGASEMWRIEAQDHSHR